MKRISLFLLTWALIASAAAQTALDTIMNAYKFQGSVLVARKGEVLLKKGYGSHNDENTIYQIASVTKTFTATLILKLADQHKLSLQDKLSKYYPDYPHGDSITIENLLTHTAGIYNYTENGDYMSSSADKPITEEQMLLLFKDHPLDFSPGTGWNYSNSGYMLLGYIIQKVTGRSYYEALRRYIFSRFNMDNSGTDFAHLNVPEKAITSARIVDSSVSFAAGCIYSTVGDLYKWHQLLQTQSAMMAPAYVRFKNNYGYGWIIDSIYDHKVVSHSGGMWGLRSNFARVEADDICIVLLSNTETPLLDKITQKIFAVLYEKPYKLPPNRTPVVLAASLLQKYTGTYTIDEVGLRVDIKIEEGALVAYPNRGPRSVLLSIDETHFYLQGEEEFELTFTDGGKKLVLDNNGRIKTAVKIN